MPTSPDPFHVLRTHSAPLASVAFGANNTLLYSGDQDGFISITDLRTRRSVLFWQAHQGGILGVGEWDGRLISHGRDNLIHIYDRIPLIRRSGHVNPKSSDSTPGIWKSLVVNTLNFCRYTLLPIPKSAWMGSEAEALLSVPNLLDTELADIYHIPSMKRIHAGINMVKEGKGKMKENAGKGEPTRSGLIMSLHLRWLNLASTDQKGSEGQGNRSRLVLVLGYEDGRVDMWGINDDDGSTEKGKEKWRLFTDGSGQVGKRGWEVMWTGKGHNEAIMAMTVTSDGRYAYSVSADHLLVKYDIADDLEIISSSPKTIHQYSTKQIGNASIAISFDDAILAIGGWDGRIRLFSASSGKPLGILGYHRETVQCLAFPLLSSGSDVGEIGGMEASTIELGDESDDSDDDGEKGVWGRDRWFVSGGKDRRVALWELMDFQSR